ncbi:hypothetical protein [Mycobacterium colombiense]|uniref:hypothetical protein n=1 Tax=Mycobacterium colombiense TaxID=339268 RepID=UPI00200A985A|nr:hypothetical protein [Mycobacterium colombiense]MCK8642965.1 hypothetical protein [Mycobacterium colombiense]
MHSIEVPPEVSAALAAQDAADAAIQALNFGALSRKGCRCRSNHHAALPRC